MSGKRQGMTTTTSRTASRAPATGGRSRLTLVADRAPGAGPAARDDTGRHDWVRQVLGVTVAVHARGPAARGADADGAVRSVLAELSAVERLVAADRPSSQLSRLARGDLALADAHPVVQELHELCVAAHVRTGGVVDAWSGGPGTGNPGVRPAGGDAGLGDGAFAPGALVTTWALDRAARHLADVADVAFAVEAGGDLLLRHPRPPGGPAEPWHVEIEHPRDRRLVLATLPVHDGAVATAVASGAGQVVDLRSGIPEPTVLAATVVGPSLVWSDVWARAAVARGTSAVDWVATLPGTRGLLVLADGTVHRWHHAG